MPRVNVEAFLAKVVGRDEATFVAENPHCVLVEVEASDSAAGAESTEHLDAAAVRRQASGACDAIVLTLDPAQTPLPLGRGSQNALVVDHTSISKVHAKLELREGQWWLIDLGSTNGTQLNRKRLEGNQAVQLKPDDDVHFGKGCGFHYLDARGFFAYLQLLRRFGL